MRILGIVLVVLGALALYFRGIPYTSEEKVLDLGPIQASARQNKRIEIPAWASGGVLAIGVLLVATGGPGRSRKR